MQVNNLRKIQHDMEVNGWLTDQNIQAQAEKDALTATRAGLRAASPTSEPVGTRYFGFGSTSPVVANTDIEGSNPSRSPTPLGGRSSPQTPKVENVRSMVSPSSLESLIRIELDHIETRLKAQISNVTDGIQKTEKVHEVAVSRLDRKMNQFEVAHFRLEKTVSEMSGTLRGLSDETQAQIRHADIVESKLWGCFHTLEDEFRQKLENVGLQLKDVFSNYNIALVDHEDTQKRLSHEIKRMAVQIKDMDDLNRSQSIMDHQSIMEINARLEAIELSYTRDASTNAAVGRGTNEPMDARLLQLEQQSADVMQKLDRLLMAAHGDDGWDARFQRQEVRLQGMRSKLDCQDTPFMGDQFRRECEQRFDQLRRCIQDMNIKQLDGQEQLEAVARSSRVCSQVIDNIQLRLERFEAEPTHQANSSHAVNTASQDGMIEMREQIQDLMFRMPSAERLSNYLENLKTLAEKLTDVQSDMARQPLYVEANPSRSNVSSDGEKRAPEVDGADALSVEELVGRITKQEAAVEFIRKQIAEIWDQIAEMRDKVVAICGKVSQELSGLCQQGEEGAKLEERAQGLATMDRLLDNVAMRLAASAEVRPSGKNLAA